MDGFALKFAGALFAIMNPISNLPVFLSVTDGATRATQRQIALKLALYVGVMGTVFGIFGNAVLTIFGISVDDFRIAGGLVVLLLGLNMLSGQDHSAHYGTQDEKADYPDAAAVAFYPLTFPILMGPGTITTLIVFSGQAQSPADTLAYWLVFGVMVAGLAMVFWFAGDIGKGLTTTARVIMGRLMGMILAAIAVDMITTGLKVTLPGLAG